MAPSEKPSGPITPSSISTVLLLLRTALTTTLGHSLIESLNILPDDDASKEGAKDVTRAVLNEKGEAILVAAPISTWVKEKGTGKLMITVGGKKGPTSTLPLLPTPASQIAIFTALTTTMTSLLALNAPITNTTLKRSQLESKYGAVLPYDLKSGGQVKEKVKKVKPGEPPIPPPPPRSDDMVTLSYSPNAVFGVSSTGLPLPSTGGSVISKFEIIHNEECSAKGGSFIAFGTRKVDITLYFKITTVDVDEGDVEGNVTESDLSSLPSLEELDFLIGRKVTSSEGKRLLSEAKEAKIRADVEEIAANAAALTLSPSAVQESDSSSGFVTEGDDGDMVVTAYEVKGKIDYNKLIDQFGSVLVDPILLARLEAAVLKKGHVKSLHRFIRRAIFFSHRDLDKILTLVENDKPFYLYTGRGPSSQAMHLGHLVPFLMTKWLQEAFDVPLVIQMTDDEKFLWKGEYVDGNDNLDYFRQLTVENAKDIVALGFKKKKTFIFSDCDYIGHMYPNIVRIWKAVSYNTAQHMFGFVKESNIGQSAFPAIQAAPSFPSSFAIPLKAGRNSNLACLVPCAIDQDPYFRMTRDIAHKLVGSTHPLGGKPALYHSKFFPPLQGALGKMSSSDNNSAIFLTDNVEEIKDKIKNHAFSGGQETAKLQREFGADLEMDVSYQWLRFFLEDDEELASIEESYSKGKGDYWNTSAVKERLVKLLIDIVGEHQKKREFVTEEIVAEYMRVRELQF